MNFIADLKTKASGIILKMLKSFKTPPRISTLVLSLFPLVITTATYFFEPEVSWAFFLLNSMQISIGILALHFALISTQRLPFSFYITLHLLGATTAAISSFVCVYLFLKQPQHIILDLGNWFTVSYLKVDITLLFDSLSLVMFFVVSIISVCVQYYSKIYMFDDPETIRFFSFLTLFSIFMLILVISHNLFLTFLGWEGVGLASYLLINFWHTRPNANKSALKAVLVNRIGDSSLMLSMATFFYLFGTLDYSVLFVVAPSIKNTALLDFASITLLGGAMAKSAQIGLHTWLPDAMEGPSPVSALIHAATMVTAGVFLIIRFSPIIELSNITRYTCIIFGTITAFFASTSAIFQNDIKRVIAYSTCSQLGYMMFACGLSGYNFAIFHLFNHAFFKALLFLSAGAVIHALSDEQDMRAMGGLLAPLQLSYLSTFFGSVALMGLPFLSGFYSKDGILELAFATYLPLGYFAYILGGLSAFATAFYSIRLISLTFLVTPMAPRQIILASQDAHKEMAVVLYFLLIPTCLVGYLAYDAFIGPGTDFWGNSLMILPANFISDSEFLSLDIKLFPVVLSLMGIVLGIYVNYYNTNLFNIGIKFLKPIYTYFNYKWFFDPIYNYFIVKPGIRFGYRVAFQVLDRGIFEWVGPFGLAYIFNSLIYIAHKIQSGIIYHYLFLIVGGVLVSLCLVFIPNLVSLLFLKNAVLILILTPIFFKTSF